MELMLMPVMMMLIFQSIFNAAAKAGQRRRRLRYFLPAVSTKCIRDAMAKLTKLDYRTKKQ